MGSISIDRNGFLANVFLARKGPCRAASIAALTLSGEQTVDGVALVAEDRVLVKNQSSSVDNGIYIVKTAEWERADDFNQRGHADRGTTVLVTDGTTNALTLWYVTTTGDPVPGQEAIAFARLVESFANLSLADGTAAAPSLFFTSDTDTGIYRITDNVFGFAAAGTGVARIDITGLKPVTNDAATLGSATLSWADLFLASGGTINFNNGNATITHSAGVINVNGTPFDADVQGTGLNGIDENQLFIFKTYDSAPGSGDHPSSEIATLRVQRHANYTGGTPGNVESAIWANAVIGTGPDVSEQAILATLDNSAVDGENCAIFAVSKKQSGAGETWASALETQDFNTNPSSAVVGQEILILANGGDASGVRVLLDMPTRKRDGGGAAPTITYGVRLNPTESAVITHGMYLDGTAGSFGTGINLANGTYTGPAIHLGEANYIALDDGNARRLLYSAGQVVYQVSGTSVLGISDDGSLHLGGTAADRRLHSEVNDAVTNAVTYAARLTHTSSGTVANSFGVGLEAELENASGTNRVVGTLDWTYTDATNASEDADLLIGLMAGGAAAATIARFKSSGRLGIGVDPAVQLDVAGTSNTQIRAVDGGTVDMRMLASSSSSVGFVGTFTAHDVIITRNNTNGARLFSASFSPQTSDGLTLGAAANQWADLFLATGGTVRVNNVQVLTTQGAAVADATDAASVILRLNELLARCRAHGLIAT